MTSQEFIITNPICNLYSLPVCITVDTGDVFPKDFSFEIDKLELTNEWQTRLPDSLQEQKPPEVDADEFETLYKWFLS